jgi:leucyl-tRNA synthetase
MAFNTAIAAMMIFVNDATKAMDKLSRRQLLRFAQLLQPFAPHVAEELWQRLGGEGWLAYAPWPRTLPSTCTAISISSSTSSLASTCGHGA